MRKILLILFIASLTGIAVAWHYVSKPYEGNTTMLYIPKGTTAAALHDSLISRLGIDMGNRVFISLRGLKLIGKTDMNSYHGAFSVDSGASPSELALKIHRGAQRPVHLTFNNIRTIEQLAGKIGKTLELDSTDFLRACDSILPKMGFHRTQYAAAFIPDTYEFYWTALPQAVVKRLVDSRNAFWTNERKAKAASLGLNPETTATLASIVEEETNNRDERPIVARLYLNRLDKGMKLQADPTVKYAIGDFGLRRITNSMLAVDSPYNTYKYAGLPPGPIRIPDKSTLQAILDAPTHNYLYMCAKDDFSGRHNFANDYASHQVNANKYRQALNRRHIK